jgi:quinolinate synthase
MAIQANSVNEMYQELSKKLSKIVPSAELKIKAELAFEINKLKKEKGAIILGHNYMEAALFLAVPDIIGDSLELSRKAAEAKANIIIFCGVRFMAETAKILNPSRTVLLPATKAGCSLASSITADDVRELKQKYPGVPVITYINTYADVKAECDICCTSGNAHRVVKHYQGQPVIFLPDQYLASNVANEVGRNIKITKRSGEVLELGPNDMLGWDGKCEVHEQFTVNDIVQIRKQFPEVSVIAHPECSPEVVAASDYSSSTSAMTKFVREGHAKHYLILTECSMADNIIAENPDKDILRLCSIRCPHMNEITLESVYRSLTENYQEIHVPEDIASKAKLSLERMLAI